MEKKHFQTGRWEGTSFRGRDGSLGEKGSPIEDRGWRRPAKKERTNTHTTNQVATGGGGARQPLLGARVSLEALDAHDASARQPLPPSEVVSLLLATAAWGGAALALGLELRWTVRARSRQLRFALLYVLTGHLVKARFVLLLLHDKHG
eukprot:SM000031S11637  [mRNA]  locus=s31:949158:951175:- [translate_table: standard]